MARYEIRAAHLGDLEQFIVLARFLNTVNLPSSESHIRALLEQSERSFRGDIEDPARRRFVFVLVDHQQARAAGTSSIVAQLGRRDAPYIYFDVLHEKRYSRALDAYFRHQLLRLGFSYQGPTELAGLIVHPEYRRTPERLGLLISYIRFLYIASFSEAFQSELLAELLPPLQPDGTSHLWEALGRHFTGLTYIEADLLSSGNKDFIKDLFPTSPIYASLLSEEAQSVIGEVGMQTKGVEKMLRRVGFRYAQRIDPFDGGPHFVAATDDVALVKAVRKGPTRIREGAGAGRSLLARLSIAPPYIRAVLSSCAISEDGELLVPADEAESLDLSSGDEAVCLPLP